MEAPNLLVFCRENPPKTGGIPWLTSVMWSVHIMTPSWYLEMRFPNETSVFDVAMYISPMGSIF